MNMMNDKLNEMIHELHCHFKIDYIFRQGDSKLFILFSDKEKKSLEELVNRIKKLDYSELQTVCFFTLRVNELLENGSPGVPARKSAVYTPRLKETPRLLEATTCATNARKTFEREDLYANAFRRIRY